MVVSVKPVQVNKTSFEAKKVSKVTEVSPKPVVKITEPTLIELINAQKKTESVTVNRVREMPKHKPIIPVLNS